MGKAFQRRCIACRQQDNKYNLIRIVKTKTGEITIDKTGKLNTRGAYICNNIQCLEKAAKTNRIEKVLKNNVNKKIYDDIRGVIIDNENSRKKK